MKFKTKRKFKQIGGAPLTEEQRLQIRINQLEDALRPFAELPIMDDDEGDDDFAKIVNHARYVLKHIRD